MIPLFAGLTAANLLVLITVFAFGWFAFGVDGRPTGAYTLHLTLGIFAGLLATLSHLTVYTYFMATSKWLRAATHKGNLDPARFVVPAAAGKRRVLGWVMGAIVLTMVAMFAGAGADPTVAPWWPGEVHLALALLAVAANEVSALAELRLIREQGRLMDEALEILNRTPGLVAERA